ncbi:hypothetical protein BC830DRAFT_870525 [Chytriomyces sp. MP71]|nr:hypothetical protein BC830DRAFT_870525 [Chytriomyces sp. MP71]
MDPLHQKLLSDLLEMRRVLMERTDALVQLLRTDTASKLNHMRNPTQTAYIGSSPDSFESVDVDSLLNAEAARQSPSQHKFQGGSLTGSPLTPLLRTITFQSSQPDIDQFMDLSPSQVQNDPKPSSNKPPAKVNSAVVTPITSMTPAAPLSAFYDEQPDIDALLNRAEGHLDQGVRWDATDYAADIAANKSTRRGEDACGGSRGARASNNRKCV